LKTLRDLVAAEGEAIAPALAPAPEVLGPLVAAAAGDAAEGPDRALVMEAVLEGYLLHFGSSRLLDTDDRDLRLLAGDYMYALGLSRLAGLGDLEAVRALAELITLSARHHAAEPGDQQPLDALWVITALALGAGPWPAYEEAIAAARKGPVEPAELHANVSRRAADTGVRLEAQHALIAFRGVATVQPHT
jgi:hypothetical protein